MENSIPALVIGAILLLASSLLARSGLQSYSQLGDSFQEMEARYVEQVQTRVSIISATLDAGGDTLTIELRNEGGSRIGRFDRVDLILTYYISATEKTSLRLPYVITPTLDSWTVTAISDDGLEPGILNPGETAQIEVELSAAVEPNKTNGVLIATETGVSVSAPFTS